MAAANGRRTYQSCAGFKAMTAILDKARVAWSVERGGKHWKLVFVAGGKRHVHPFSGNASDVYAATRAAADIRRILRSCSA